MRLQYYLQIAASMTGKVLVVADPLYTTGPQSCGIFGSSPGYVTNGQVSLPAPLLCSRDAELHRFWATVYVFGLATSLLRVYGSPQLRLRHCRAV